MEIGDVPKVCFFVLSWDFFVLQMLKIPIADLNIQGGHFKFKIVKDTISVRVLIND